MSTAATARRYSTFKFFDRNKSGEISINELRAALQTLGQKRALEEAHAMMASAGCAEGDELDFERYSDLAHSMSASSSTITRAELKAIYASIDIGLSGSVTVAEIWHFMNMLNVDMDDEEMSEIINMYDLNDDKQISIVEFEAVQLEMGYAVRSGWAVGRRRGGAEARRSHGAPGRRGAGCREYRGGWVAGVGEAERRGEGAAGRR